ncbi:MAG: hypothetical protein ACNA7Z_00815 [Dethiobacteria bacterium]
MHSLRLAAKIVIGFIYSLFIILTFLTTSLFGVRAQDTVRLIITEATGLQRDMVAFQADLQPLIIHNLFWVCLASLGFMLIFLYFIDHSFRGFLGPGILSIAITIFLAVMLSVSKEHIFLFTGPATEMYIQTALDRFNVSAYAIFAFGLLLVAASLWGDQLFKKNKN